jgi:hypothetical protein
MLSLPIVYLIIESLTAISNYPVIEGKVGQCGVNFKYRSEVTTNNSIGIPAIRNTIYNYRIHEFCIDWKHAGIYMNNRNPVRGMIQREIFSESPIKVLESNILIGAASRCSTVAPCYAPSTAMHASGLLNKHRSSSLSFIDIYGEKTESNVTARIDSTNSIARISVSMANKGSLILSLPAKYKIISNTETSTYVVRSANSLYEALTRYDDNLTNDSYLLDWVGLNSTSESITQKHWHISNKEGNTIIYFSGPTEQERQNVVTNFPLIIANQKGLVMAHSIEVFN